jgi:signal transduction histidine kinase
MNRLPARAGSDTGRTGPDSQAESRWIEDAVAPRDPSAARWMGSRVRALVLLALLGSLGLFALIRVLALTPRLDVAWRLNGDQGLVLAATREPGLAALVGRRLVAIETADRRRLAVDSSLLLASPRWIVDGSRCLHWVDLQDAIARAFLAGPVRLVFEDAASVEIRAAPRGFGGMGLEFWPVIALALVLYLIGLVVPLLRPQGRNLLFGIMALAQTANLTMMAIESLPGLGLPPGFARLDLEMRTLCDVVTAAAGLHAFSIHPLRLPHAPTIASLGWALAAALIAWALLTDPPNLWWATQALLIAYALVAAALQSWSNARQRHPFAVLLLRFALGAAATLTLLTGAVAGAAAQPELLQEVAGVGSVAWTVFFASLLLLVPFLSRSRRAMREFALLAGVSTVATSLDLLFIAVFALSPFASLTLSLFLALGLYIGTRQWIVGLLTGSSVFTVERMFESLYRAAREVQQSPQRAPELLLQLLREHFEPIEVVRTSRSVSRTRVTADGSTLVVPIPAIGSSPTPGAIVLRFARRGRSLFTRDDARLTDRLLEQWQLAVAFDRAVEQGRNEERMRIAQDLHDDIGARLLTLMYKAPNAEMEEYVRHTLQDLKTLTRGLAAPEHRLSDAVGEWKSDIGLRLGAAKCELDWSFTIDRDLTLTVVQWSALTRVLRELVNNIISHAGATRVDVAGQLEKGCLTLRIADNGRGRDPQTWAHGLGLGGVRKRVRLLEGEVRWLENGERGVVCEVVVPGFDLAR